MDTPLRCNNIRACRKALTDQAVVTTCSHIFCLPCAHKSGLSQSREAERKCPACSTQLSNPDDAVTTILQPTEDYKTSVLSGLDPTTIMECAGRALAFWTYQTTQEILYNEAMGKNLADKCSHYKIELEKTISDANSEIKSLHDKIKGLQIDQKTLHQRNVELVDMYREKSKKQAQIQHMYDTLKKRVMTSQVQTAASDSVRQAINSMSTISRPQTLQDASVHPNHPRPHHSRSPSQSSRNAHVETGAAAMPPPPGPHVGHHNYGFASHTPQHRTHLPGTSRTAATRSQIPLSTRTPGTVSRQPLGNITHSRNSQSGSSGYGISAGMKVGRPPRSNLSNDEPKWDGIHDRFNANHGRVDAFGNEIL